MKREPESEKKYQASITVFLALIFVCIAALLLTLVESARTCGARLYLQVAADAAMESLFSQFHRRLWEDYRVLGLEFRDEIQLKDEYYDFIEPYLESKDWYPSSQDQETIIFSEQALLTEENYLEEEILEYMKYGLAETMIEFCGLKREQGTLCAELGQLVEKAEESVEIRELQERYRLGTEETEDLEQAIGELSEKTEQAAQQHREAAEMLAEKSAGRFFQKSSVFREGLREVEQAVDHYTEAAERLQIQVTGLRNRLEEERSTLSQETIRIIEAELEEYETYVSDQGEQRIDIESMKIQAELLQAEAERQEEAVHNFDIWVSERLAEQDPEDESYYDYRSEIENFYNEQHTLWMAMELPRYEGELSQINQENKQALDRIGGLVTTELMELVLPEGVSPSKTDLRGGLQYLAGSEADLLDKLILTEYTFRYFSFYQEKAESPEYPDSGSKAYEVEYLIAGEKNDYQNLSAVVKRMLLLREAMNMIYLFTDAEKRSEARVFAAQFLCMTANPALLMIFTFFILGVWAMGQAIADIRMLLSDGRVPLLHSGESWSLDLPGLLQLGKGEGLSNQEKSENGMSYQDYLRVFLYGTDQKDINRRMLAEIERNISSTGDGAQAGFTLDHCLYAMKASVQMNTDHILYRLNLLKSMSSRELVPAYSIQLETYYKYKNKTH